VETVSIKIDPGPPLCGWCCTSHPKEFQQYCKRGFTYAIDLLNRCADTEAAYDFFTDLRATKQQIESGVFERYLNMPFRFGSINR